MIKVLIIFFAIFLNIFDDIKYMIGSIKSVKAHKLLLVFVKLYNVLVSLLKTGKVKKNNIKITEREMETLSSGNLFLSLILRSPFKIISKLLFFSNALNNG